MTAALVKFEMHKTSQNQQTLIPVRSNYIDHYVLAADTEETITAPAGAKVGIFNATGDVWYNFEGTTANSPDGDVTNGTGSALNVGSREVEEAQAIGVICVLGCLLSVEWYS